MAARNITKHQAGLYTRVAQTSLVVLVLASGAVAAFGLPGAKHREPGELELPAVESPVGAAEKSTAAPAVDYLAIADRISRIRNPPKPPEAVITPTKQVDQVPQPTAAPDEVRYLGAVGLGARMMALISIGGRQQFVSVGDKVSIGTVKEVTATEVRIEGPSGIQVLQLAERGPEVVTRTTPGAASRAMAGNVGRAQRPPGTQLMFPAANAAAGQAQPEVYRKDLPEYVTPDNGSRYEQLRAELKSTGKFSSEEELNETAAKVLEQELSGERKKDDQR